MRKLFPVLLVVLFCASFSYSAVTVSLGKNKKVYENTATFAIDAQEDTIIESDGLKIVVPKGQKVMVSANVNEKGETIITVSGTGTKNIKINGYSISSNEKSSFTVNSKTGEVLVQEGYLTIKDSKGNTMFAGKGVPFTIDLSVPLMGSPKLDAMNKIVDKDEKKQEEQDLSPSTPR